MLFDPARIHLIRHHYSESVKVELLLQDFWQDQLLACHACRTDAFVRLQSVQSCNTCASLRAIANYRKINDC